MDMRKSVRDRQVEDKIEKKNGGQFLRGFRGYHYELGHDPARSWKPLDDFRQGSDFMNDRAAAGWLGSQSGSSETS